MEEEVVMGETLPPINDAYTESGEPFPDEPLQAYQQLFEEVSYTEDGVLEEPEQPTLDMP